MSVTNKPLDDLEAEINEVLAAATPGPWVASDSRSNWWSIKSTTAKYRDPMGAYETPACVLLASQNMSGAWCLSHLPNRADERLIANAPRYLAALLSEVRRLRTELNVSVEGYTAQCKEAARLRAHYEGGDYLERVRKAIGARDGEDLIEAARRVAGDRDREKEDGYDAGRALHDAEAALKRALAGRELDEARAFADARVAELEIAAQSARNQKNVIDATREALDVPKRKSLVEHARATVMALRTERERAEKAERDSNVLRGELMKWHSDRWHDSCLRKETDLRERAEKAEADLVSEKKHYAAVQEQWKKECAERHEQARQAHEAEQLVKKQVGAIERLSSDLSVCRKALEERGVLQNERLRKLEDFAQVDEARRQAERERDAALQEVARLKEPMEGWVRIKSIDDDRARLGQMHREAQERAEKAEAALRVAEAEVARLRKDAARHGYNA